VLAVVGAAMELRLGVGTGKCGEEAGDERREKLLCEVGMRRRDNFVLCARSTIGDEAVVLWFGRSCAKTRRDTFESGWIGVGS
jgi:hypothetical protein